MKPRDLISKAIINHEIKGELFIIVRYRAIIWQNAASTGERTINEQRYQEYYNKHHVYQASLKVLIGTKNSCL